MIAARTKHKPVPQNRFLHASVRKYPSGRLRFQMLMIAVKISARRSLRLALAVSLFALFAPARTSPDIIERLNRSAASAVRSETFKALSANEGLVMMARLRKNLTAMFAAKNSAGVA